jgi:gamma-glutamylcyclotransferase (GGCT)/AIG2-like uncharacterized protein YtfP
VTSPGTPRLYFAYGLNMDRGGMAERAPGAHIVGRATLDGHRFAIGRAGHATILASAWERVHGVLWSLTEEDERALDEFEGVGEGLYRKEQVSLVLPDGTSAEALTYVACDGRLGRPDPTTMDRIIGSARQHHLPEVYVAHLRTWAARA